MRDSASKSSRRIRVDVLKSDLVKRVVKYGIPLPMVPTHAFKSRIRMSRERSRCLTIYAFSTSDSAQRRTSFKRMNTLRVHKTFPS